MRPFAAILLVGLLLQGTAAALSSRDAADHLHAEVTECLAFYALLSEATAREPDTDTAIRFSRIAARAQQEARYLAQHAQLDPAEADRRLAIAQQRMIHVIEGSFRNMGLLIEQHAESCKRIVNDPAARHAWWMKMQKG